MYELSHIRTLFPGDSEIGMLMEIFQLLGTPTEETWPEVSKLKWFKPSFPRFKGLDLDKKCFNLGKEAVDLLRCLLNPCPYFRIEAHEALKHPWFDDLDKSKYEDPSSLYVEDLLHLDD